MTALRWLLDIPNGALRLAGEHLLIRWLRDGRAGLHGALAAKTLAALEGKKTLIGLLLSCTAVAAETLDYSTVGGWLWLLAVVATGAGITDKAIRTPGRPELLANSDIYRLLARNAGVLASAFTSAFVYVSGASCTVLAIKSLSLSCSGQGKALLVCAALLAYLGIFDQALLTTAPWGAGIKRP